MDVREGRHTSLELTYIRSQLCLATVLSPSLHGRRLQFIGLGMH